MADLRGSGEFEQSADQIILLYREKYYSQTGNGSNKKENSTEENNNDKELIIGGLVIVIWLALILAPISNNGLFYLIEHANEINPYRITINSDTFKVLLFFKTSFL